MKTHKSRGEIEANERSKFIKNYKTRTKDEMFGVVCILEEAQLSNSENVLCDIFRLNKTTLQQYRQVKLLEMSDLCQSMISIQCEEIEFFRNRIKLIQSVLD